MNRDSNDDNNDDVVIPQLRQEESSIDLEIRYNLLPIHVIINSGGMPSPVSYINMIDPLMHSTELIFPEF